MPSEPPNKPERIGRPYIQEVRNSHVADQYPDWVRNNRLRATDLSRLREASSNFGYTPLISILLPVGESEPQLLGRALDSALGQVYPLWELCICTTEADDHIGETLSIYERMDERIRVERLDGQRDRISLANRALATSSGEFVCFLEEGDELAPDALFEIVGLLQEHRDAGVIYSDNDEIDDTGERSNPCFKPGWSPSLLLSHNYLTGLCVYRKRLLDEVGGLREGFCGGEDYDLALRATEKSDGIHHVPKVLYHRRASSGRDGNRAASRRALAEALERRGVEGSVEDGLVPESFRVRFVVSGEPKVSIIIPTRDNVSMLRNCAESIERLTTYSNYEILIVDNESVDPETVEYLAATPHRVLPFRETFNFSKINNYAVAQAEGEYVLFLNDDTEVVSGDWLREMLGHAQRPEVGAVGAKLVYPNGRVQHAGVLVGVGNVWAPGIATHAHQHYPADSPGYMGEAAMDRNYSAVTAACMMLRRAVFEEVGGFEEENLSVSFNDVDLCLRIRERGYEVVYTPYAELYHYESASRGYKGDPAEALYMRKNWAEALDNDPYYNPNFSSGQGDFQLRADMLRSRTLRNDLDEVGLPKHPLEMEIEELRSYMKVRQGNARSSRRTGLVPAQTPEVPDLATEDQSPNGRRTAAAIPARRDVGEVEPSDFFVVGQPKSGTSWVRSTLDSHPEIACLGEGKFFGRDFKKANPSSGGKLPSLYSFFADSEDLKMWARAVGPWIDRRAKPDVRQRELERHTKELTRAAIAYFMDDERRKSGKPIVGDKTPAHTSYLREIQDLFPEARIIHIIRDGRDQAVSSVFHWWKEFDKPQFSNLPSEVLRIKEAYNQERESFGPEGRSIFDEKALRGLARGWRENVSQAMKLGPELFGNRYFELRYEDLLEKPESLFTDMFGFLGADADKGLVEECVRRNSFESVTKNRQRGTEDTTSFFRKGISGDWKNYFTKRDIRVFDEEAGDLLLQLGYTAEIVS